MSKNFKGTLNSKRTRIAKFIMAAAKECGYTVDGDPTKFHLHSKYKHAADYWVQYNSSSGYFEGFIFIEKLWVDSDTEVDFGIVPKDDPNWPSLLKMKKHPGFNIEGWSHGLWSIRNTMDANAFCNMIAASMALRGKSKLRVNHNVAA